ncbi:MAG: metal-dependent transcriptional regulator [Candidatus Hodarchaeota archaeon]
MSNNTYSESYQEYLEEIYRLSQEVEEGELISNSSIADRLKIKPPSVTEMLNKLEKNGLIVWKKRKGVQLTDKGKEVGKTILETHHLLEEFFSKVLELDDLDLKHRVACDLEHHLIAEPKLMEAIKRSIKKVEKSS